MESKTLLWLDDIRNPFENNWLIFSPIEEPYDVIWLKTYSEFVSYINNNCLPNAICFDHDLGDENTEEKTGYDCAKFLVEYCMDNNKELPEFNIQSANPIGKENILSLLNNFKKTYI